MQRTPENGRRIPSEAGKAFYCRMMSIIETAKRKGEDLLECIKAIFQRNMVNLVPFPA